MTVAELIEALKKVPFDYKVELNQVGNLLIYSGEEGNTTCRGYLHLKTGEVDLL